MGINIKRLFWTGGDDDPPAADGVPGATMPPKSTPVDRRPPSRGPVPPPAPPGSALRGPSAPGVAPGPVAPSAAPSGGIAEDDVHQLHVELEKAIGQAGSAAMQKFVGFYQAMSVVPDEAMRIKAAVAATEQAGFPPADVLSSIDGQLRLLPDRRSQFEASLDASVSRRLDDLQTRLRQANDDATTLRKSIDEATAKMQAAEAQAASLERAIAAEKQKLADGKARIAEAAVEIAKELQDSRAQIGAAVKA